MDLRGLEAVIAVHDRGSFTAAAEELFISQPALTRRVAMLERELNVQLFVRGPRGVLLTPAGQALLEPARRAVQEAAAVRDAIDHVKSGVRGALSIVGMVNLTGVPLGRLVSEFHAQYPEVEITVAAADTNAQAAAMVEAGVHDVAVIELPIVSEALVTTPVRNEEFYVVLGPGQSGAAQGDPIPTVTRAMLDGRTMVHLPAKQFPKQRGMALWQQFGLDPRAHMEVANCGLIVPIAKSSRAVAVLPRGAAFIGQADGLDLALPPTPIRRLTGLAMHRASRSTPVRRFVSLAAQQAELTSPRSISSGIESRT